MPAKAIVFVLLAATVPLVSQSPAGANGDVQYNNAGAFGADTGKLYYIPSSHMLSANVNGKLNSDIYGGITTTLSSTECTSGCDVYRPFTSIGDASFQIPSTSSYIEDHHAGNFTRVWRNPTAQSLWTLPTGQSGNLYGSASCFGKWTVFCDVLYRDTPNPTANNIVTPFASFFHQDTLIDKAYGWSFGNAPGAAGLPNTWSGGSDYQITNVWLTAGITQTMDISSTKLANGDDAGIYAEVFSDGGADGYSDEGVAPLRMRGGETPNYFHGKADIGTSAGTQALPITTRPGSTINRNVTTAGSWMIDTSKAYNGGNPIHVIGASQTIRQLLTSLPSTTNSPAIIPVDVTLTPSTFVGIFDCNDGGTHTDTNMNILNTNNPQANKTLTCKFTKVGGTGDLADGLVYIAGDFPEQALVSGVTKSDGVYTATITYRRPHGSAYSTIWQGSDVQGMLMSVDRYSNDASSTGTPDPNNPRLLIVPVAGAYDSNHIAVTWRATGGEPNPYVAPVVLQNLTKTGTTLTATLPSNAGQAAWNLNSVATAYVDGCSDSPSLNGPVTNVVANLSTFTFSATQTSGSGTSCSSATLNYDSSMFGVHLYPGAGMVGPATDVPGIQPLEPNNVSWAAEDDIEAPHHPIWNGIGTELIHQVYNAAPNKGRTQGLSVAVQGAGVRDTYSPVLIGINNNCPMYAGCGGDVTPVPYIRLVTGNTSSASPNAGFISASTAPLPGYSMIVSGCQNAAAAGGGCTSNIPYNLYANSGIAGSQLRHFLNTGINGGGGNEWNLSSLAVGNPALTTATARTGNIDAGGLTLSLFEDDNSYQKHGGGFGGAVTFVGNSPGPGAIAPLSRIGLCSHLFTTRLFVGICTGNNPSTTDGDLTSYIYRAQHNFQFWNTTNGNSDVFLNRVGSGNMSIGSSDIGTDGTLTLRAIVASGTVTIGGNATVAGTFGVTGNLTAPNICYSNGTNCSNSTAAFGKVTITVNPGTVNAGACEASAHTATLMGVTTSSSLNHIPASSLSAITGWGPTTPGLWIDMWPTANTINWKVCNSGTANITSGSFAENVGAIF